VNKDIAQVVRDKREEILRISASHGAHNVRIFGSVARGEAGPDSDVDFLVSESTKRRPPETPWHEIAGFRNVIVHSYLGIDLEQVWLIVEENLVDLQDQVETMISSLDDPS
jgi:predicted nucleotidyltransferase